MNLSRRGLSFIKRYERFAATVYRDAAGKPTIGYGHLVRDGETFGRITKARALEILAVDVGVAERAVERLVQVPLSQGQFDALVSFVFNVGGGAFADSTLLKRVNAREHAFAPMELTRWIHANKKPLLGLARRRADEAVMYVRDDPL